MANILSRAARELRQKLTPAMKQSELADQLGVSQQAVSAWLKGRARPDPERMAKIEEILGIPMRSWVEPMPESGPELSKPRRRRKSRARRPSHPPRSSAA